jgi:hypothetical protein
MECYTSRRQLLGWLVAAPVLFVVCCYFTTQPEPDSQSHGWLGVVVFGLVLVVVPYRLVFFRRGPQVIINDAGIEDRRMGVGVIAWEDVRNMWLPRKDHCICIDVHDPAKDLARVSRWKRLRMSANRLADYPPLTLVFVGLTPGADEVWAYLQRRAGRATGVTHIPRRPTDV